MHLYVEELLYVFGSSFGCAQIKKMMKSILTGKRRNKMGALIVGIFGLIIYWMINRDDDDDELYPY